MTELEVKCAVRERDGFRCTVCGMTQAQHIDHYGKALDVHRLTPGSEYTVEGCVTVCRDCHGPLPKSPPGTYPNRQMRIADPVAAALDVLASRNASTAPVEANRLIREGLEKLGLWPPPGQPPP